MQIDFHHGVTYVVARLAGFSKEDAEKIAYSSQYVDDAVNEGAIFFKNGAIYNRINSAHKMLDYRNFDKLANHYVWIPFHFLPGNGGLEAGKNPDGKFIEKIICTPNSYIAQDMIEACLRDKHKDSALQRLGITLHVYADTWAHQNFAGVNHKINEVKDLSLHNEEIDFKSKLKNFFGNIWDEVSQEFLSHNFPLGHGGALTCPDKPYLEWSYINGHGQEIKRNNTEEFMEAIEEMYKVMLKFQDKDYVEMNKQDKDTIKHNLSNFKVEEGEDRHKMWLNSIVNGDFSFGKETLTYIHVGKSSWKFQALNKKMIVESKEIYEFDEIFLKSNWKFFHDALLAHRFEVVYNILPKYGICVA